MKFNPIKMAKFKFNPKLFYNLQIVKLKNCFALQICKTRYVAVRPEKSV